MSRVSADVEEDRDGVGKPPLDRDGVGKPPLDRDGVGKPPLEPLIGKLIDGRYRVERAIGSGGFGTVYYALHVGLGAPVALKVLKLPERLREDRLAQLVGGFFEEARTLKLLRHPNIVAALDVGVLPSDGGLQLPYLVMEWCDGVTLGQILRERAGPLPLADAWQLFEPLLDAMAHAHAAGVAHRDLKPGNVLVERLGDGTLRPRVIDFGIAKIVAPDETAGSGATNTVSGSSPFTPRYAAPEQLAGARTGPWTDVHALALLFVELVVGHPAIGRDADAMLAVFDPVRPTPGAHGVDVGPLEPVLGRALALRPVDRYADAGAFASAMRDPAVSSARSSSAPSERRALAPAPASLARSAADQTAPPSSHTLRTLVGATEPRALSRRSRARRVAAALVGLVLVGAVGGAARQRATGGWPFRQRLRDLTGAELERRAPTLGLGRCIGSQMPNAAVLTCPDGLALLTRVGIMTSDSKAIRTHVNAQAFAYARNRNSPGRFAIDGDVALIVVAGPDALAAAFDRALGGASFELRDDATGPPIPQRTVASFRSLAAWTGDDLVSSVHATGVDVTYANADAAPAVVTIGMGAQSATVQLYRTDGPQRLALARGQSDPFVYALEGSVLLLVRGNAEHARPEFLANLLDGAHTTEVGSFPAR